MTRDARKHISIINRCTLLKDSEIEAVVPAMQTQVSRDFAPVWGVDAVLTFVPRGKRAPKYDWWIVMLDTSDDAGLLGVHDMTPAGRPLGKVFVKTDKEGGYSWTRVLSHEVLEMLGDPDLTLCSEVVRWRDEEGHFAGTWLVAYEMCDACQDDEFGYEIDGVLVSDFVTPEYYETFWKDGETHFDFRGHIRRPLQILEGGYLSVKHESGSRGWQELGPPKSPCTYKGRPRVGSRRERRRIPRDQWLRSQMR
jgi:hypothetical protein